MTGMALDRQQHRTPPSLFPKKPLSPSYFPRISDPPSTVSPTVTRSVRSLMTASTAWSPTVQSENTTTKHGIIFTTKGFWQLLVVSPIFLQNHDSSSTVSPTVTRSDTVPSLMTTSTAQSPTVQSENIITKHGCDFTVVSPIRPQIYDPPFTVSPTVTRSDTVYSLITASTAQSPTVQSKNTITKHGCVFTAVTSSTTWPPTVQSEATNKKHDYNSIEEGFWQISQQLNALLQKTIELKNITQKVHNLHTDSAKSSDNSPLRDTVQVTNVFQQVQTNSDADSFDDESSPRGDTSDRKFPAFWHFFFPPKHHEHTPSVKLTRYYDYLKYICLFLIILKIDNRYGNGWNKILFEDRFGDGWHK